MRFGPAFFAPLALLLGSAAAAESQYIHGRVTDAGTGEGVSSASVLIVNPDNSIRTGAITDRRGNFRFRTTPGAFLLRVQRVGYATTRSTLLELARSDTLNFAVRLPLRPADLDPLTVTAIAGTALDPSGFYGRRDDSQGRFLGPYEVERRRPVSPADLLHDIPGYQIRPDRGGFRVLMTGRNRRCIPTVYVDGALAHRGTQTNRMVEQSPEDGVMLESLVNANAIRAMEAYQSGATAPARFRPTGPVGGGDCGVLVFWTRIGLGG
jgi:hypothetical protein